MERHLGPAGAGGGRGARRGLDIVVKPVGYTRASIERAIASLLDPANAAQLGGLQVTSVAGPTLANDQITVAGVLPGRRAVAVKGRRVVPGHPTVPYSTRSTDTGAKNAGGMIRGSSGAGCTSGFAIRLAGFTWTTTARHCTDGDWSAYDLDTPESRYGDVHTVDAGTGNRVLAGDGYYWVFDGAWDNASGYHLTVNGLADVSEGSSVCSSGANSGVHCDLIVENTMVTFNDGFGTFSSIRVHARSGIAGARGDSGGPILIPSSDGVSAAAVGMLQGSQEPQLTDCGPMRIAATCSEWIEFTSERTFLANIGATLFTESHASRDGQGGISGR
ncbi:chymotrypsin family serine protease [Paractinoplanes durhamensis]|uniref:hypothetical protein n=1 Tax=Paractinoplanes durhamensis TaxID=113563 RepID=UPI0036364BC1